MQPFSNAYSSSGIRFTFAQEEPQIVEGLKEKKCYKGHPMFCPTDIEANDSELDPISKHPFYLPHDIALFAIMKRKGEEISVNSFQITFEEISLDENDPMEPIIIGYPTVISEDIKRLIFPAMDGFNITLLDLEEVSQLVKV